MAAVRKKKKAPAKKKPRRWIIPKILLLLGTAGLLAFIFAIFVMQQELNRLGFFTNVKRPSFQLPTFSSKPSSTPPSTPHFSSPPGIESSPQGTSQSPAQTTGQTARVLGSSRTTEDISHEDRKRMQALTSSSSSSRSAEDLSHDDRKHLEDILRSR